MKIMKLLSTSLMIAAAVMYAPNTHAQIASDNAGNYSGGWTNESNGGTGFGPWTISVNQDGTTHYAGAFIGNPNSAGISGFGTSAFGLYANPLANNPSVVASRDFSSPLQVGQTFSLQWAVNWDTDSTNRKGFRVFSGGASGTQLLGVSMNGFPGLIEINRGRRVERGFADTGITFSNKPMTWKVQLVSSNEILVTSTARDGSAAVVYSTNIVVDAAPDAFALFCGAMTPSDNRQPYYNNFEIFAAPSLAFTPDSASPASTGDIVFTLTREVGSVEDDIDLSSDNTDAVTVPASVSFVPGEPSVTFTGTVVSLLAGSATITAVDGVSEAEDTFTVNIPLPSLTITGPTAVILGSTNTYTVTRTGFVGDEIDLASDNDAVVSVPASATITEGNSVTFEAVTVALGSAGLSASGDVATSSVFNVAVVELPPPPEGVYDDATYYPAGWSDGSNGGNGFGAWTIGSDNGNATIGNAADQGTNSAEVNTNGVAFRLAGTGFVNAGRSFGVPLAAGDVFTFQLAYRFDNGNSGFNLRTAADQVFNFNISGGGFNWTGDNTALPIPWDGARENGAVLDVVITATAGGFDYSVTSAQDETLAATGSVVSAALTRFELYVSGTDDTSNDNAMYANRLAVELAPVVPTLSVSGPSFIMEDGIATYQVTRAGGAGDEVFLASSSVDVTIPASVTFGVDENIVRFKANGVSVAENVTITATNSDAISNSYEVDVVAAPTNVSDVAANYDNSWFDGDKSGNGFGAWTFNHSQGSNGFAGVFIGNPADAGIGGMPAQSFGFYANPIGSGANAEVARTMPALAVGDTFSFVWGLNWDSNDGGSSRGFSLLSGATEVLNLNMAGSEFITIGSNTMLSAFGTNAITVTITHETAGNLRVTSTGRDGVESFTSGLIPVAGVPNNFKFYFNATGGETERQMYVNNFAITEGEGGGEEPSLPTNAVSVSTFTITGGQPSVTVTAEAGLYYYLVYPTGTVSQVTAIPVDIGQWGVADQEAPAAADGPITLQDTSTAATNRVYGVLIRTEALDDN
jgi:hypothetical protein